MQNRISVKRNKMDPYELIWRRKSKKLCTGYIRDSMCKKDRDTHSHIQIPTYYIYAYLYVDNLEGNLHIHNWGIEQLAVWGRMGTFRLCPLALLKNCIMCIHSILF